MHGPHLQRLSHCIYTDNAMDNIVLMYCLCSDCFLPGVLSIGTGLFSATVLYVSFDRLNTSMVCNSRCNRLDFFVV